MKKPELGDTVVGTVVKILGRELAVRTEAGTFACHLRGRLFNERGASLGKQVTVGDEVELTAITQDTGVIHRVLPRKTAIVRRVGRARPSLRVLAANVDQIVVVSALREPHFKTGLIDRYLVIAHDAGIDPALCLNKVDLGDAEALSEARTELEPYRILGYPLVETSAKTGAGLRELRAILKGKRSVLTGHSGVGKSKLAAALQPGLTLSSAAVDRRGRGRHTTTASTLIELDFGGELVDTPGVRELSFAHIDRAKLAEGFLEFRPYLQECHFVSCSHIPEPHCAVKRAVAEGEIARSRYESYRHLYEELG